MKQKQKIGARRVAVTGVLAAVALALSALENMIPQLPFLPPGMKIGLSNLAVMFSAGAEGLFSALCIALIKGIFAGLTRGFAAMCMSMAGGLFSALILWLVFRNKNFGLIGAGVLGALAHNAAQLAAACALTSKAVLWYAPVLILMSVLTGTLTGIILRYLWPLLEKLHLRK